VSGRTVGDLFLDAIFAYPLKAARAVALPQADALARGLRRDRRWLLVAQSGEPVMLKSHPRLATAAIGLDGDALTVAVTGGPTLHIAPPPTDAAPLPVTVKRRTLAARVADPVANRFFSELLGETVWLAHLTAPAAADDAGDPAVSDGLAGSAPYLVCCDASLADLNRRLAARGEPPVGMDRFRANLVIRGGEPYAEDGWRRLRVGGAEFEILRPCPRCPNTTVDSLTGAVGPEPLRTLTGYRTLPGGVMFGVFARVVREGLVRPGDPVVASAAT
jgi:uncharacterized protein